jgi:hypothetical protein
MQEAGIKPEDIDAVVLSHAHIDHIGGIVGADDKPLFPNAQYYIAQSDLDFWTDEGKMGSPLKDFVVHARKNLLPVRDRIVFFKDGQEFLPGIQAMAAPGHTVGHRGGHGCLRVLQLHGRRSVYRTHVHSGEIRRRPGCHTRGSGHCGPGLGHRRPPDRSADSEHRPGCADHLDPAGRP